MKPKLLAFVFVALLICAASAAPVLAKSGPAADRASWSDADRPSFGWTPPSRGETPLPAALERHPLGTAFPEIPTFDSIPLPFDVASFVRFDARGGPSAARLDVDSLRELSPNAAEMTMLRNLRAKIAEVEDWERVPDMLRETGGLHLLLEYESPRAARLRGDLAGPAFTTAAHGGVAERVSTLVTREGGDVVRSSTVFPLVEAKVAPRSLPALIASPDIAKIHLAKPVRPLLDVAKDATLAMPKSQFADSYGLTGAGVRIAIVDSGIDPQHPDFQGRILHFRSFVDECQCIGDDGGHGTHVASIAAGAPADGVHEGVAPGAILYVAKVFGPEGGTSDAAIIAAIEWALDPDGDPASDDGANIISMSLGGPCGACDGSDPLSRAVNWAVSQGTIVVVAAGNEGPDDRTVGSPGVAAGAITVGAYDDEGTFDGSDDTLAHFSSRGPTGDFRLKPEVVAPGVAITAANAGGDPLYVQHSGTSMATPAVSGLLALLLEQKPGMSPAEAKARLASTALPLDGFAATEQGLGRVQGVAALDASFVFEAAATDLGGFFTNTPPRFDTLPIPVVNLGEGTDTFTFTVLSGNDFATLETSTLSLEAGESGAVETTLSIDGSELDEGRYEIVLVGESDSRAIRHVLTFEVFNIAAFAPFRVDSDADLAALAASDDNPFARGDGSSENPFVLERAQALPSSEAAIYLGNTTLHVLFDEILIDAAEIGLHLHNARNVHVNGSVFGNLLAGIVDDGGIGNRVEETLFMGNFIGVIHNGTSELHYAENGFLLNFVGAVSIDSHQNEWHTNAFVLNFLLGGLLLEGDTGHILRGNEFFLNLAFFYLNLNLVIHGDALDHYDHDITPDNLVNGLPFYHQFGGENFVLEDASFGGLVLVNVNGVEVSRVTSWIFDEELGDSIGADGILLVNVDNAFLTDIDLDYYTWGTTIAGSRNVVIDGYESIVDNLFGIVVGPAGNGDEAIPSQDITVGNAHLANYAIMGVGMNGSLGVTIKDSLFEQGAIALYVDSASAVTLERVSSHETAFGLLAIETVGLTLTDSSFSEAFIAALVEHAENALLRNNDFTLNHVGVALFSVHDSLVIENAISNNMVGLGVLDSSGNTFRENTISGNGFAFENEDVSFFFFHNLIVLVDPAAPEGYDNAFIDNLVEGHTLQYFDGATGALSDLTGTVIVLARPYDLVVENAHVMNGDGLMILGGTNVHVKDSTIEHGNGILIHDSTMIRIEDSSFANNLAGVLAVESSHLRVFGNDFTTSFIGIETADSIDVVAKGNVFDDMLVGLLLGTGTNTAEVSRNFFSDSSVGFAVESFTSDPYYAPHNIDAHGNEFRANELGAWIGTNVHAVSILGNNFYEHAEAEAIDNGHGNRWSASSGGNYWESHESSDSNGDGFLDDPRHIRGDAASVDAKPFALPIEGDFEVPEPELAFFIPLEIHVENGGGALVDWARVGVSPSATNGFDPDLDQVEPPRPMGDHVQLFLRHADYSEHVQRLNRSHLPFAEAVEWRLDASYEGAGGDATLSWPARAIESIPEGLSVLLDTPVGTVDMRATTTVTVPIEEGTTVMRIRIATGVEFVVDLVEGWNMVSLPLVAEDMSTSAIFGSGANVYHWTGTHYVTPEVLEPGKGYWVLALAPRTVSVTGTPVTELTIELHEGWNMVGGPLGDTEIQNRPSNVQSSLFHWTGSSYSHSTTLEEGKGYWLLVTEGTATVTIK